MKIGKKLFLSFTVIFLFVLLSGIIAIFYSVHINSKLAIITEITNPAEKNLEEMVGLLWRANYIIQRFSSETNEELLDDLEDEFETTNELFLEKKESVLATIDNEVIGTNLVQAEKKQENFYKFAVKLIEKRKQETYFGDVDDKQLFFIQYSILKQLEKDVVDAVELLDGASVEIAAITAAANEESLLAVRNAIFITLITTLLGLLSAGLIWSLLTKSITKPINALANATAKLSTGNFDVQIELEKEEENEFVDLATTFNQMVAGLKTMIEESPRLKKFIKIQSDEKKENKYIVERGVSYLIKDPSSREAYDILLEQMNNGATPMFITRQNPRLVKDRYGVEKEHMLWLSEAKEKGVHSTAKLDAIERLIKATIDREKKVIILFDRVEYLVNIHGFEKVFALLHTINDLVMSRDVIFLLPIDPAIFNNQQLSLLEKELNQPPQKSLNLQVSGELRRILTFIENRKAISRSATYKDVGQEFHITAPTTQKKITELHTMGLIKIEKVGRKKVLELTRDGERVLAKT